MPRGIPNEPKNSNSQNAPSAAPAVVPNLAPNTKAIESADLPVGQDRPLDIPVTGSIRDLIRTDQEIEIVPGPALGD